MFTPLKGSGEKALTSFGLLAVAIFDLDPLCKRMFQ
jgi:hypothetical protein